MGKEQLEIILKQFEELNERRRLAMITINQKKRAIEMSSVDKDIANYAAFIPFELKEIFNKRIGPNSLNYQHADDISYCIDILRDLIKQRNNSI